MSDKAKSIKQAATQSAQSLSSPCTTVCSTLNCQKPLSREETEKLLRESVNKNRANGMNELDAMAEATREALRQGADIGHILDTFSTKSWVDFLWENKNAPIQMGTDKGKNRESGFDPSIDDDTWNQMGHIMAYIRYAYKFGGAVSREANEEHDPPNEWKPKGSEEAKKSGKTKEDYDAGLRGASIGERLGSGNICLEDFPDILKNELGVGGANKQEENIAEEEKNPPFYRDKPKPVKIETPWNE